ncbi:MAG: hypothetical protein KF833_00295 [Verrucomicrobiae bacterium]|nr:hypothetical protein [Verrucomicrobiae bacterium]
MTTPDPAPDWATLDRLRERFLSGTAGHHDYWSSDAELAGYDATFAQRIGWKWAFVLDDLARRGWIPPGGDVLDWGCGTGIAGRVFLERHGTDPQRVLWLHDRSPGALEYASTRARTRFPGLTVRTSSNPPGMAVALVSHVLTELTSGQVEALVATLTRADAILWIEPGTPPVARTLVAVRERLTPMFHPVAPCVHARPCGLLAPGRESDWCHHFATPPPGVFTDPFWARFGQRLGIDLRSVPLSYLVLDRRPPPPLPRGAWRLLGRPGWDKAHAHATRCDGDGVRQHTWSRREHPAAWRGVRKDRWESLQDAGTNGGADVVGTETTGTGPPLTPPAA